MTTVLIADDDKGTRLLLEKVLRRKGLDVVMASDGLRARMILEDNPHVRVLVTDVIMPIVDGRDLVSGLRREAKYKDLGIIVMSATVTVGEITRLLEMGASRFLAKPVNEGALLQEMNAILAV